MLKYHELKSLLLIGGDKPSLKPLWDVAHDIDREAAKELIWKLLDDADTSEVVRFASTIYLGYMGDSGVTERLRLGYSSPVSVENLGYIVALANLNELDALLLLRDELTNPKDEYSVLRILGCTRNCSQFEGCNDASELVSKISGLILNHERAGG
jgi:hypothetical protein